MVPFFPSLSFPSCPVVNNSLFSCLLLRRCCCFHLSPLRILCSIPSYPSPFPSQRRSREEAATLQSRSAVPSSPLPSSPLPSVRSFQTLLRISLPPASPRSLLGGERRGESGGTTERRGNVYYVRDGAKSKMGRRSGDSLRRESERASEQPTNGS